MLINLKRSLKAGDTFVLTLRFQNARTMEFQTQVQEN